MKKIYISGWILLNILFFQLNASQQLYFVGAVVFPRIESDVKQYKVIELAQKNGFSFAHENAFIVGEKVLVPRSHGDLIVGRIVSRVPGENIYTVQVGEVNPQLTNKNNRIEVPQKTMASHRIGKFPLQKGESPKQAKTTQIKPTLKPPRRLPPLGNVQEKKCDATVNAKINIVQPH